MGRKEKEKGGGKGKPVLSRRPLLEGKRSGERLYYLHPLLPKKITRPGVRNKKGEKKKRNVSPYYYALGEKKKKEKEYHLLSPLERGVVEI